MDQQSIAARKPSIFEPQAGAASSDAHKAGSAANGKGEADTIALAINQALTEMRHMIDSIATATRDKNGDIQHAAESLKTVAAEKAEAVTETARTLGRDGLNAVSKTVSTRPLAAVAVAAGIGLLLGLMARGNGRA